MKKIFEKIKKSKNLHYIILVIIGFLVSIPFLWVQLRETDDGYVHILRIISLGLSFDNVNFPYLLTPFFCRNFGYTMIAFYGPLVTYIPYAMSLITNSVGAAVKLFAVLTIPISGIFMYNFMYEITKNKGISFLSGIIYMIFPYKIEVYFNRFAMGEFTALIFLPIVFQGLCNLLHGDGKKHFYITIGAVRNNSFSYNYNRIYCIILFILYFI